ncbi:ATR-interacting protein ATM and [Triplophysa tibetana]|uniref:ATR-interacting protein ATM and n=1 Tax=Triplophysa tibetana TaxID=1572043 RepID=A0A5A9NSG5_9TELE|nr:ATR-interacting protein ATM and [Triplophysa tibetana]
MSALTALAVRPPTNHVALPSARKSCPPAVHFLPLLTFHINTYCQTLESIESSGKTSLHGSSLSGSSDASLASSLEESLSGQEELTLAAMNALYHVVCCSCEALEMVLCQLDGETQEQNDVDRPQGSKSILSTSEHQSVEVQTQMPLMKRLLQLADPGFITAAGQREAVIRMLTKLFTQNAGTWANLCKSSCQCIHELVRTVVVMLHTQWLKTKGRESQTSCNRTWSIHGVQVLREALMFLHWLLLKDSSFSEHCLDVLHMYDQVIPAIRDTFRLIPDLTESEELAVEEICRSETEDVEDMDTEAGP